MKVGAARGHDGVPPYLEDGCRLLEAAFSHGLQAEVFPRQVAVFSTPGSRDAAKGPGGARHPSLAFVHGVPQSSTLAGVTYAQDKRISRGLLQRARLPPVPGATFSFRGIDDALVFASRIGFPVTIRLAQSDGISMPAVVAEGPAEFEEVMRRLRVLPEHMAAAATNVRRSAYSLTTLLEFEEDEQQRKLWAISTRVLVQKELPGAKLRLLVVDGEVAAAIQFDAGRWRRRRVAVANKLHHHVPRYAVRAVEAIPGLRVASVDMIVDDPSVKPVRGSYYVADVVERPCLHVHEVARTGRGRELATLILEREARRQGLALPAPTAEVSFDVAFDGVVHQSAFTDAMVARVSASRCDAEILGDTGADGVVGLRLTGDARRIAELLENVMAGHVDGHRAGRISAAPLR